MKKTIIAIFAVTSMLISFFAVSSESSGLDDIKARKVLLVGTTGDYKPFSYLNKETNTYEGMDIDAAKILAKELGVEVRFVATTWKELTDGILKGKYDIAMSGITRNLSRQAIVGLTDPYINVGKSPLIHTDNKDKFKTLADIDKAGVTIGVNLGGTNEKFVKANIKNAKIVTLDNNLDIPPKIESKEFDVMITDNVEAMIFAGNNKNLYAVSPNKTFTNDDFGYMLKRDDFELLNYLNLWIHQMHKIGKYDELKRKWIAK